MSDAIFDAKCEGMAIKKDALRDAFERDGSRLVLLKRGANTSVFSGTEITSGHRVVFDHDRSESGLLRIATVDASFRDTWAESTHVGYGVPDEAEKIEVFGFIEGEKDTI